MLKRLVVLQVSVMLGLIIISLPGTRLALALTVEKLTFEDLVHDADSIVIGVVDGAEAAYGEGRRNGKIFTSYRFSPTRVLKGDIMVGQPFKMSIIGGRVGDMTHYYPGVPQLQTGTRYALFIAGNGVYAVPLVGATQGIFTIVEKETGIEQVAPMSGAQLIAGNSLTKSRQAARRQPESDGEMSLDAFIEQIKAVMR